MAWFSGKVSLGNFPDLAGAVNKLSESVKNIEKNFDSALGLEEKSDASTSEASGLWPSATDRKALFEPIMGFMGQKSEDTTVESLEKQSPVNEKEADNDTSGDQESEQVVHEEKQENEEIKKADKEAESGEGIKDTSGEQQEVKREDEEAESGEDIKDTSGKQQELKTAGEAAESGEDVNDIIMQQQDASVEHIEVDMVSPAMPFEVSGKKSELVERTESLNNRQDEDKTEAELPILLESVQQESTCSVDQAEVVASTSTSHDITGSPVSSHEQKAREEDAKGVFLAQAIDASPEGPVEIRETSASDSPPETGHYEEDSGDNKPVLNNVDASETVADLISQQDNTISKPIELKQHSDEDTRVKEQYLSKGSNSSDIADSVDELEKVKKEIRMMETALLGAARQAQAKADEIAKLMNENEQLKSVIDDLRRKTSEADESLREEYHQRVAALERKVYALTRERDTLRREHNKKSDAAALLKEKDEIINQVMAEGEQLSKKQAAQESHIRKLRAQIRELEEEKKGLLTKLQVEENKVESMNIDKAATEKLLQETVEKHQAELATQKEYYTNALNEAKEAEALAEARANTEARAQLESRLREAEDRESMLVQTIEELRQTLSRMDQKSVFREDMLRKDIEDLQKRYQASERRCEELITQVPDSTRPLLRQIEAMQETAARRAEAWAAVERSLNSRLQETEAKAATAEEKERSINERLTQTLSRINVLEAQISCLRAEQTQLSRSLEKERQKAAENKQDYLALKEEADTHAARANQLEEEMRELRRKHMEELHEALMHQELLQRELEREKTARLDQERAARIQSSVTPDRSHIASQKSAGAFENGNLTRHISSASSLSSMEESYILQTTLDSSENFSEHRSTLEGTMSPYYMKNMTSSSFEAALRQKEGELASYMSRLASLESIRDSLAEELVKMTEQCEKLRTEAARLPGLRAELEALRRRHSAALELMGERDEELEELRADIVDLKEMYKEQVNLLVNKIQIIGSSQGAA